jgi:hypothetical protein
LRTVSLKPTGLWWARAALAQVSTGTAGATAYARRSDRATPPTVRPHSAITRSQPSLRAEAQTRFRTRRARRPVDGGDGCRPRSGVTAPFRAPRYSPVARRRHWPRWSPRLTGAAAVSGTSSPRIPCTGRMVRRVGGEVSPEELQLLTGYSTGGGSRVHHARLPPEGIAATSGELVVLSRAPIVTAIPVSPVPIFEPGWVSRRPRFEDAVLEGGDAPPRWPVRRSTPMN